MPSLPFHPLLETDRLILRDWNKEDDIHMALLNQDADVMRHFPKTLTDRETKEMVSRIRTHLKDWGYGVWAVESKATGQFIGCIGFDHPNFEAAFTPCVEILWRLDKNYWNQGLASEGAKACLLYAFLVLDLPAIYSWTTMDNTPSERVMQKIGLQPEGIFLHPNLPDGHPMREHKIYTIERAKHALSIVK